jgi:polar amino acid transport system substrate-binding protein
MRMAEGNGGRLDEHTRAHSDRVAFYAAAIAGALGVGQGDVSELMHAGRLHDAGKVHTPERILRKPGRLTREEFEIVKMHCAHGERIATELGEERIATWIRHHHERWDGKGYPDGLIGSSAPLESRILAVADALDAMTSDRPYALSISFEEAATEIEANAGTQFDPPVAEAMVTLIRAQPSALRASPS